MAAVKSGLLNYGVMLEDFGGEAQCVEVSAKQGIGIDELLEKILLQAEVMNLRGQMTGPAQGTVVEARMDKGLGVSATVLVQKGQLRVGDLVLAGPAWGRVKRLLSDQGTPLQVAGPSTPAQVCQAIIFLFRRISQVTSWCFVS